MVKRKYQFQIHKNYNFYSKDVIRRCVHDPNISTDLQFRSVIKKVTALRNFWISYFDNVAPQRTAVQNRVTTFWSDEITEDDKVTNFAVMLLEKSFISARTKPLNNENLWKKKNRNRRGGEKMPWIMAPVVNSTNDAYSSLPVRNEGIINEISRLINISRRSAIIASHYMYLQRRQSIETATGHVWHKSFCIRVYRPNYASRAFSCSWK